MGRKDTWKGKYLKTPDQLTSAAAAAAAVVREKDVTGFSCLLVRGILLFPGEQESCNLLSTEQIPNLAKVHGE